jgi:virginiamycin B lyase
MWFSEGCADDGGSLAEIAMPAGPITEFPVPGNRLEIFGIATGADGNIWFAGAEVRGPNIVGKMTTSGVFTKYPLGAVGVVGVGVSGPDGAVWFPGMQVVNDVAYGYVVRVAMDGSVSAFAITSEVGSVPTGIVTGADGNLWVAAHSDLYSTGEIVKVTTGGQVTEYPTQSATSIARSTKNRLFFGTFGNQIGEISLTGNVRYINLPPNVLDAEMVALAPDGKEWFVQPFDSGGIFVYTP